MKLSAALLPSIVVREEQLSGKFSEVLEADWDREEGLEEGAQKPPQRAQQEGEVVAGGGEHGVGAVAVSAFEVIAVYEVVGTALRVK